MLKANRRVASFQNYFFPEFAVYFGVHIKAIGRFLCFFFFPSNMYCPVYGIIVKGKGRAVNQVLACSLPIR